MVENHSGAVGSSVNGGTLKNRRRLLGITNIPKKVVLAALLSAILCAPSSQAKRNKKHSCTIIVLNGGTIRPNIDNTALTSKVAGAYAGTAVVKTTRNRFRLQVQSPLGFTTMPSNGSDNVVFASTFLGHGATNFSERPGENSKRLKKGRTRIEAHFLAKKTNGLFEAGHYSGVLTLRCE